jgi:hypothetical protein
MKYEERDNKEEKMRKESLCKAFLAVVAITVLKGDENEQ